jgi:hypothetical protein
MIKNIISLFVFTLFALSVSAANLSSTSNPLTLVKDSVTSITSLSKGGALYFSFPIPKNSLNLSLTLTGTNGDADIYLNKDKIRTSKTSTWRSAKSSSNEKITIARPVAGTYYLTVLGYEASSNLSLTLTYTDAVTGAQTLVKQVPLTVASMAQDEEKLFTFTLPSSSPNLVITTSGTEGDVDIYLNKDTIRSTKLSTYKSTGDTSDERIVIPSAVAGTYYLSLRAYTPTTNTVVTMDYGTPVPVSISGSCGTSANQTLTSSPVNLCTTGSASSITTTDTSYTWACSSTNGGTTASCSASKPVTVTPTPVVVNGSCGTSANQTLATAPTTNLCATGTASSVTSGTSYTWSCSGGSGVSCAAPKTTLVSPISVTGNQCNDGIDNDGDGLTDWQMDLGCENQSGVSERAASRAEKNGFSTFDPDTTSRIIYVSNSTGNDTNDGLTPAKAVKTIVKGASLVRDGQYDFLLLKRGDVWRDQSLYDFKSGKDTTHPLIIASYGASVERPRIENKDYFINHGGRVKNYVAILGVEFYGYTGNPADPAFTGAPVSGLRYVGGGDNLLIEDTKFTYGDFIIQSYPDGVNKYKNVEVRRNVVLLAYHVSTCNQNASFRPSGIYTSHVDGLIFEGNFYDHNGWNESVPTACATMYNHNFYVNGNDMVLKDNLITRGSSMAIKTVANAVGDTNRMTIDNNFMYDGEIGISAGGNATGDFRYTDVVIKNNVFSEIGKSNNTGRSFSWALDIADNDRSLIENNYFLHQPWYTNSFGISMSSPSLRDTTVRNNIFYNINGNALSVTPKTLWSNIKVIGNTFASPVTGACLVKHTGDFTTVTYSNNQYASDALCVGSTRQTLAQWKASSGETSATQFTGIFSDPSRTLASYAATQGYSTVDAFLKAAQSQGRLTWKNNFTATTINQYIKSGFVISGQTTPTVQSVLSNGMCGDAIKQSQVAAPTSLLCAAGASSSVSSTASGYIWSCGGTNGGVSASCTVGKVATASTTGLYWVLASRENNSFLLIGTQTVRYGFGSTWIQKVLSGRVDCTNTFFGNDPLFGTGKQCEVLSATGSATGLFTSVSSTISSSVTATTTTPVPASVSTAILPSCGTSANKITSISPAAGLCSVGTSSSVTFSSSLYRWTCSSEGSTPISCAAVTPASISYAGKDTPSTNYIGMNPWFSNDYDGTSAFVDMMKQSRYWQSSDWHTNISSIDADGWPMTDASTVIHTGEASTINGTHKLVFEGQADVSLMWANGSITNKLYNQATNITTADITYVLTPAVGQSPSVGLIFKNTKRLASSATGTGFANARLYREGYPADGSITYTTPFLNTLAKTSVIRMMDWTSTNTNTIVNWSDRKIPKAMTKPGLAYTGPGGYFIEKGDRGVSLEDQIALCNAVKSDCWLNIPPAANDDYVRKVALALRYGTDGINPYTSPQLNPMYKPLASDLKVYVEYANEIWNSAGGFQSFRIIKDIVENLPAEHPLNTPVETSVWYKMWKYQAYRIAITSDIFRSVYGDSAMMSQIRPVIMTQQGNGQDTLKNALTWLDAYAKRQSPSREVSYYAYGAGGSAYYGVNNPISATDQGNPDIFFAAGNYPAINNFKGMAIDAILAGSYGLKRVAYEGGPSLDNYTKVNAQTINADPRMQDMIVKSHNEWSKVGGDLLVYYALRGPSSWEFTPDITSTESAKLRGITQLQSQVRAPVSIGQKLPGILIPTNYPDYRTRIGSDYQTTCGGSPCLGGNDAGEWIAYPGYTPSSFVGTISLTGVSGKGAQIYILINGIKQGSVAMATSSSNATSTLLNVTIPSGLVVIKLEIISGGIDLRSINVLSGSITSGGAVSQVLGASTVHYVWNHDLQIGKDYPKDIEALQTALAEEGLYTGDISGGYYSETFKAVKLFQEKNGIKVTGYVGLLTRNLLNQLYEGK